MLKRRLCEATITWRCTCEGPLLIADGRYEQHKEQQKDQNKDDKGKYPDKVFISRAAPQVMLRAVREHDAENLGLPYYVPGTSLRGPFRAHAERIIRSLQSEDAPPPYTACDPFAQEKTLLQSCSRRFDETAVAVPYAAACPACKLFGCTGTASRIQFTDADIQHPGPNSPFRSVYRDMIGIDRFTGGVSGGANMRFHALENTAFTSTVTLTNFELWQLGLCAYVLRDFQLGMVPIGFGKTKGFGIVQGTVESIRLSYVTGKAQGRVQHLGSLANAAERRQYHLHTSAAVDCALRQEPAAGLSFYDTFLVEDHDALWSQAAKAFNDFMASPMMSPTAQEASV